MCIKRIFRYVVGTKNLRLWYLWWGEFSLVGCTNAYCAGYKVDRKSTSRNCEFLGQSLISWYSKKQNSAKLLMAEVGYIVVTACCAQLLWIMQQLYDLGINIKKIPIKSDNKGVINIIKNQVQ